VCHPKEEGGLGIKSKLSWNNAAIMQLGWGIVTKKDSMWVSWCNRVLLRGKSFWAVKVSAASSWCWRKVLRLRDFLARNLVYIIGDGRATALWLDPWFNGETLFTKYGTWVVNDADIPLHAKVSAVIANRQSYGVAADNQCMFGCGGMESIDHIFFGCKFTTGVWNNCLRKYGFHRVCSPWREEAVWV
ncbi:zf-RVT domain-containing protein, partial [Cephalotus follicularis]